MGKVFTQKQLDKSVEALKKLVEMPEVKDIIQNIILARKPIWTQDDYFLILTKNGLIKNHSWISSSYDFCGDCEHESRSENEKITLEKFEEITDFFDLNAEEIIAFSKKLR